MLLVNLPGAQEWHVDIRQPGANGNVNATRQLKSRGDVGDGKGAEHLGTGDDPVHRQHEVDAVGAATGQKR